MRSLRALTESSLALLCIALSAGCDKGSEAPPEPSSAVSLPLPSAVPSVAAPAAPPAHGAPPSQAPFDPARPEAGGVRFTAPDPFVYRAPNAPMRTAEYVVTGTAIQGSAVLVVHHFPGMGGTADANVKRWVSQFKRPDGGDASETAKVDEATVNGLQVVRVDVSGTYSAMQMGPASTPPKPEENQRLLGAIVMAPTGPVFFKLTGPAALVETALPAFDRLVASFAPAR